MRRCILVFALTVAVVTAYAAVAAEAQTVLNAKDFDTAGSLTGGIQEAIDRLPEGGGAVFVPEGTYVLGRPVFLKRGTRLTGAGAWKTVLKKNAAFRIPLAEEAKAKQDYVILTETTGLKENMVISVADRKHPGVIWGAMFFITGIEGNKVSIRHVLGGGGLRTDLSPADGACAMNLFMVIKPSQDCIIEDMELDGGGSEQRIEEAQKHGFVSYGMLWCGIYPANDIQVYRCRIHDAGIGIHVNGNDGVEVEHCEIYNNWGDGIHCGGGPLSIFTGNRIYGNRAGGITFCYGNVNIIIRDNEIFGNTEGISALGINEVSNSLTADRCTIIEGNRVYGNSSAGIASGQGPSGPQDFIFSNNTVLANNTSLLFRVLPHQIPSGIQMYSARGCVVRGNRSTGEAIFSTALERRAEAGQSEIVVSAAAPAVRPGWLAVLDDGKQVEVRAIKKAEDSRWTLSLPLNGTFEPGTPVRSANSQPWGIFCGGPESEGNLLSRNDCRGTAAGGILWQGGDTLAVGNQGTVSAWNAGMSVAENVFPAAQGVPLPNPGFEEDGGWGVIANAEFVEPGYSGKRSLKMTRREDTKGAVGASTRVTLKQNTWYRLSARVKSRVMTRSGATEYASLPYLFLHTSKGQIGAQTVLEGSFGPPVYWPQPDVWYRVETHVFTGNLPAEATLYTYLAGKEGDGWVDDVRLEEIAFKSRPSETVPPHADRGIPARSAFSGPTRSLPAGVTLLDQPILLKPGERLAGTGPGTVLKRPPIRRIPLQEDVSAGSGAVTVRDAAGLKEGMAVCVADRKTAAPGTGVLLVSRIEGTRVTLKGLDGSPARLKNACSVQDEACIATVFPLVIPAAGCRIEDLVLDGGLDTASADALTGYPALSHPSVESGILAAEGTEISRCQTVRFLTGVLVRGQNVRMSHCRARDNFLQGIRMENASQVALTSSRISGTRGPGVSLSSGCDGIAIEGNLISGNAEGLAVSGGGSGKPSISVKSNIIFRNRSNGIFAEKARNLLCEGNIVSASNAGRCPPADTPSGGIVLVSPQDCLVVGNRCLDDQDYHVRSLAQPAAAGTTSISIESPSAVQGDTVELSDGDRRERVTLGTRRDARTFSLTSPLSQAFPAGARVAVPRSQAYGIVVLDGQGTLVEENLCTGNLLGGIHWSGKGVSVRDNIGKVAPQP